MLSDPAPGYTPMAVLAKDMDGIGEFNEKYRNVYKYEVLGGLHGMVVQNSSYQRSIPKILFSSRFWLMYMTYMLGYLMKNHCDWHVTIELHTLYTRSHTGILL